MATDTVPVVGINEPLDHDSPVELWRQAATAIRTAILAGHLAGRLPSQAELAQRMGVSIDTIKQAVRVLADEGLITTTRRKGTYVAPQDGGNSSVS